jgi:hypothetical protein
MSDVQIETAESDDAAFEAEREAARIEQSAPIEDEVEQVGEPSQSDPERERLEKLARDKDGMARAERQKRRDAEARAAALETRLAALESKNTPSDDIDFASLPAVDQDPLANIEAMRKLAERMAKQQQEGQQQTEQQRQFQTLNTQLQSYEADFRADNPDYDAAAAHFRQSRQQELEEMGYSGDELMTTLTNDLVGLALRTMKAGKDPAEVVYNLAKKRGFGGETSKEQPKPVDNKPNPLQAIERGQKAAKSLSAVGSKSGDGELSVEAVMKLEGAAFDQAREKLKRQAMGGSAGWRH